MNDVVALITVDPKTRTIADVKITQKQFKFKCKRGAILCCKLGGPVLTQKDVEQIQAAGYCMSDFLEAKKSRTESLPNTCGNLKTRNDGSCIFLDHNNEKNSHNCAIYKFRPALCRLYPFNFEIVSSNCIALKFIPCCMGLNNPEANTLDEKFITQNLLGPLLDVISLSEKGIQ